MRFFSLVVPFVFFISAVFAAYTPIRRATVSADSIVSNLLANVKPHTQAIQQMQEGKNGTHELFQQHVDAITGSLGDATSSLDAIGSLTELTIEITDECMVITEEMINWCLDAFTIPLIEPLNLTQLGLGSFDFADTLKVKGSTDLFSKLEVSGAGQSLLGLLGLGSFSELDGLGGLGSLLGAFGL